ncbi:MAG: hypothetical protein FJX75_29620 [Armatimonadetes bacterium]|nr:hypothetical protein [Armatimonadota bacterium]
MRPDDLVARLDELIEAADKVGDTRYETMGRAGVDISAFTEWATSALHVLRLALGERSDHYGSFKQRSDSFRYEFDIFRHCLGVVKAARSDLAAGLLTSMQELAAAEVFDELIDVAAYVHKQGHHLSAGAIAGAVLEDSLRKLCVKHNVQWSPPSAISKLNTELYKVGVYGKPVHGQVEAWGKLRNAIDHHDFTDTSEIDRNDVKRMVDGVRDFVAKYLT